MPEELSREEKRALRKTERRKAKFGSDGQDEALRLPDAKGKRKAADVPVNESLAGDAKRVCIQYLQNASSLSQAEPHFYLLGQKGEEAKPYHE